MAGSADGNYGVWLWIASHFGLAVGRALRPGCPKPALGLHGAQGNIAVAVQDTLQGLGNMVLEDIVSEGPSTACGMLVASAIPLRYLSRKVILIR